MPSRGTTWYAVEEREENPKEEPAAEPAETSLDEMMAKRGGDEAPGEEDDTVLSSGREERVETLSVKVVPQQDHEFTCRNCHLVKHRSQMKDKKRMLCRDCA